MPAPVYAFDSVGTLLANRIVNEQHAVNESIFNTYAYIVPVAAPFYATGLQVRNVVNGVSTLLVEGIDYNTAMPFIGASRSIGSMIYGGIILNTQVSVGTIAITYQTLGGPWVADVAMILATLGNKVYNPKLVSWDAITNVQQTFPPINHAANYNTIMGQDGVIAAINGVVNEIAKRGAPVWRVVSTNTTLANFDSVMVDTTLSILTITLPSFVMPNSIVRISDYKGTFGINQLTVLGNGSPVMGLMVPMYISTPYRTVTLQYIDAVVGWKITSN